MTHNYFEITVLLPIRAEGAGSHFSVTLEKNIPFPFVPHCGLILGLLPGSEPGVDEYQVERVMWKPATSSLWVSVSPVLRQHDHEAQAVSTVFLREGWGTHLGSGMESLALAEIVRRENGWDDNAIVELIRKFFVVTPSELWALNREDDCHDPADVVSHPPIPLDVGWVD